MFNVMSKITMKQMKAMLREAQKLQFNDCGKHDFMMTVHTKGNRMWFVAYYRFLDKIFTFSCYEWRSYAENRKNFDNFARRIVPKAQ